MNSFTVWLYHNKKRSAKKPGQEKKTIIGKIFQSRLHHVAVDSIERAEREKRLNKLIKDAQSDITKALKKTATSKRNRPSLNIINKLK